MRTARRATSPSWAGGKPHLLTGMVNNLGAETTVTYAPSTDFYLRDKLAGTPWATRVPFPVHVVAAVETVDALSDNRFTTTYSYHHGYYDPDQREFRGLAGSTSATPPPGTVSRAGPATQRPTCRPS